MATTRAHHGHHGHHHAAGHAPSGSVNNWQGPQPAPLTLWHNVHSYLPETRNDGIYNPRNIAGTTTRSLHAEGRALDIGLSANNPHQLEIADQLFASLIARAGDLGLQEIIWNRQIWSSARPQVHAYTGADSHTGHIHAGFTRAASQSNTLPPAFVDDLRAIRDRLATQQTTTTGHSTGPGRTGH